MLDIYFSNNYQICTAGNLNQHKWPLRLVHNLQLQISSCLRLDTHCSNHSLWQLHMQNYIYKNINMWGRPFCFKFHCGKTIYTNYCKYCLKITYNKRLPARILVTLIWIIACWINSIIVSYVIIGISWPSTIASMITCITVHKILFTEADKYILLYCPLTL